MRPILGIEYDDFVAALQASPSTSIRLHPWKKTSTISEEKVPWHEAAYYLKERPIFTLNPSFHAGAYYVQEASSMFVAEALQQAINLSQPLQVLDLCAAPGGKSTLLQSLISEDSCLISNEVIKSRNYILQENLAKWGATNTIITRHDPKDFERLGGLFDVVVVDAPCSGEGLFRKDSEAAAQWSPGLVELCAARQKRILYSAQQLLKKDGLLLYCTCTYNWKENEDNVEWLLDNYGLGGVQLTVPKEWGVKETAAGSDGYGYRFFPHRVRGEGFFLSVLRKVSDIRDIVSMKKHPKLSMLSKKAIDQFDSFIQSSDDLLFLTTDNQEVSIIPKAMEEVANIVSHQLSRHRLGTTVGTIKAKNIVPSAALALSRYVHSDLPTMNLNRLDALRFLKKENIKMDVSGRGWHLATYQNLNLGWAKVLPNRVNNYYPKEWRIRMPIEPTN